MKNTYVRLALFFANISAAFFLEYLFAAIVGGYMPVPPLVLFTAAWWLPIFPLSGRLWLAGGIGFLIDVFGGYTPGISIPILLAAALLVEIFRSVISARDWSVGHATLSTALAVSLLILFPAIERGKAVIAQFLL